MAGLDAVVVGGGVIGLTSALTLAEDGHQGGVLDGRAAAAHDLAGGGGAVGGLPADESGRTT